MLFRSRTANRPQFQEMISTAKQKNKPFNAILVWKLSRFARNREDSIIYKNLLRKQGVEIISINEQIDDSPAGRLFEGMIEVIDEFYSTNLSQDTIRGMKENARRGFLNGGSIPYGYKRIRVKTENGEKSRLVIEEEHATLVRKMFQLSIKGLGAKEIAKTLNNEGYTTRKARKWETNAIQYILRNETYTGVMIFNRTEKTSAKPVVRPEDETIRVENAHPAILDKETFQLTQTCIDQRHPKITPPRTLHSSYLLSGFLFCSECHSNMIGSSAKGGRFLYYACRNHIRRGEHGCGQKAARKDKLEARVIEKLKERVFTDENISEAIRMIKEEIYTQRRGDAALVAEKDSQIAKAQSKLLLLYEALETAKVDLDDLAPRIKALRAQITELEVEKSKIESKAGQPTVEVFPEEIGPFVEDLRGLLENGNFLDRKNFLRGFIKRIDFNGHQSEGVIEYSFPLVRTNDNKMADFEVLRITKNGGVDGARTRDLLRDRQAL